MSNNYKVEKIHGPATIPLPRPAIEEGVDIIDLGPMNVVIGPEHTATVTYHESGRVIEFFVEDKVTENE